MNCWIFGACNLIVYCKFSKLLQENINGLDVWQNGSYMSPCKIKKNLFCDNAQGRTTVYSRFLRDKTYTWVLLWPSFAPNYLFVPWPLYPAQKCRGISMRISYSTHMNLYEQLDKFCGFNFACYEPRKHYPAQKCRGISMRISYSTSIWTAGKLVSQFCLFRTAKNINLGPHFRTPNPGFNPGFTPRICYIKEG
jgi:hypothetical protein